MYEFFNRGLIMIMLGPAKHQWSFTGPSPKVLGKMGRFLVQGNNHIVIRKLNEVRLHEVEAIHAP